MDQAMNAGQDEGAAGYDQPQPPNVSATEMTPDTSAPTQPETDAITWTASEFIENQKSSNWYLLVGLGAVGTAVVVWVLTRDLFPSTSVLIGIILLGVYGSRKPRSEAYALDNFGITIGNRHYPYHEFQSFKLIPDGAFMSIELAPLKRFAVAMTLFFDPADEEKIIDRLSQYLPMEEGSTSLTDTVMRRIHF